MQHPGGKYGSFDDGELAALAQSGDRGAENELIVRYSPLVKKKTSGYFAAGNDSDDFMQEGMIGLFEAIEGYDSGKNASFRSFASMCIERQVQSAVKTATRKKHGPLASYISLDVDASRGGAAGEIPDLSGDPLDLVAARESVALIRKIVDANLSKYEQKVLALYIEGGSYAEIAGKLGKTPKSVDNAVQRIKKKLSSGL